MSEERESEQAGAPVEQAEATDTQLLAAVERAAEVASPEAPAIAETGESVAAVALPAADAAATAASSHRPIIAEPVEPPNAATTETAEEIFASHTPRSGQLHDPQATAQMYSVASDSAADPLAAHFAADEAAPVAQAAPAAASHAAVLPPERDGEIRISSDHPMAALYMQTPMQPEARGNRGAGVLIAVLATIGFAALYAGVLALWLAPNFPPSTFLDRGLLPWVLNWGFAAAAVGFFIGLALLVLIAGRAGWWAYVLGGLLVAALTWGATVLGFALNARLGGASVSLDPYSLLVEYGLFFPVIAAALVAREATVWFGAWIGARGRKMKRLNAEALVEYEKTLAEVQAKQP